MDNKNIFYFVLVFIFLGNILNGTDSKTLDYLKQAEEAYVNDNLEEAALMSQKALLSLSHQAVSQEQRSSVINDFTIYSIAYAKLLANERHFQKARNQIQLILSLNTNSPHSEVTHLAHYLQSFHNYDEESPLSYLRKDNNKPTHAPYEATRSTLLVDVENDSALPPTTLTHQSETEQDSSLLSKRKLYHKLHAIILPCVELEEATLDEAVNYLKEKSLLADPEKEGINIVASSSLMSSGKGTSPPLSSLSESPSRIDLELHDVPLLVALTYLAQQANLKLEVDNYAVSLVSPLQATTQFLTKSFDIPCSFFPTEEVGTPPFSIKKFFESQGIAFPEGTSATYSVALNRLTVRNTPDTLDLIASLIKSLLKKPPLQVSIETKFIEVSQNDLSELGFNWLLGPFSLGNSGLDLSGGGSANNLNTAAYPFPATGMNPVGALRSGNHAISDTSIDTIIGTGNNITESSVPGIFSIGGVCTSPQFQMVVRALNQKKGIDLMAAPHVTTKNGVNAVIKIVDEFIYPSQYIPPQLPVSTVSTNISSRGSLKQIPPTITPSFPSSWTSKNLGVTLEAKPTILPNQKMISLELHPQLTDFDGFINYGTPINTIGYTDATVTNMSTTPFSETLTTNTINQPVFTVREVNTSVMVQDGQTVVIGGLIREDLQHVEDKIPILGDIPLAGRLFRSTSERKLKKNLIIFVTPKILNGDGIPIAAPISQKKQP